MRLAEERFRGHLSEDESIRTFESGRILEDAGGGRTAIGLTDRRLLCVSTTGEFVDVSYDYVCSIRSRKRSKVEYRSRDGSTRLRSLGVGFLALAATAVGVVALTAVSARRGALTIALAVAAVAVATGVEYVRIRPGIGRSSEQVFVGAGVLALLALVGVGLVATSASAPLFAFVTVGGLALAGYAVRHRADLAGLGLEKRRETHLTINTVDGETVRLVVDGDSDLGRELSATVHRRERASAERPTVRATSD